MTQENWPDKIRLEMIEKSNFYLDPTIYQFGYYDGYQRALLEQLKAGYAAAPAYDGVVSEYQLCPKCNGDGNLARYNSPSMVSTDAALICDVCNGAKTLIKPVVFPAAPAYKGDENCDAMGHYGKDPTSNICPKCNKPYNFSNNKT